jgi:hypothetical protein
MSVGPQGKVEERRIQAGIESASHIEVVEGLSREDRIVVGAKMLIRPGQVVTPVKESAN